ncbi:MAG: hypothetical protein Q9169_003341 [Polycauliona sp. 2 TL-2023]
MSPRRSSRSKTSQPTSVAQHTSSSSSSVSSARTDRKTRPDGKPPSPHESLPPKSPSTENHEASGASSKSGARRTRSSQEAPKPQLGLAPDDEDVDEEDAEEEEITRCVCGHQEYPGMPVASNDPTRGRSKTTGEPGDAGSSVTLQEDTGGLFIQCDICKVWQHGGCVGIMDEAASPEEYFCEQCRKELHTITLTATGQRYSNYRPVQDTSSPQASPSPQLQNDSPKKPKEGRSSRTNADRVAGNRRSTMNSRDAAYYEAEQLRQAIEESKKESTTGASSGSRKGKRSREDDEEKDDNKRQRTQSGSSASTNEKGIPQDDEGDIEETNATFSPSAKNIRGAAARNHRKKELRDQETKREKDRADAAGRRKGRAEKRRGDESDPSEEPQSRNTSSKDSDQIRAAATPPTSQAIPSSHQKGSSNHKRTGRPPARRGRVGRNQWTRDRDSQPNTSKNPHAATTSPSHSQNSKDGRNNSPRVNGHQNNNHNNGGNGDGGGAAAAGKGHHPKARYTNPQRTSMIEMKRRVAAMLDFINQTDRESATEVTLVSSSSASASSSSRTTTKTPASNSNSNGRTPPTRLAADGEDQNNEARNPDEGRKNTAEKNGKAERYPGADLDLERFRTLGVGEMKETMRKVMVSWQKEFG